jgi:hypothetical protein
VNSKEYLVAFPFAAQAFQVAVGFVVAGARFVSVNYLLSAFPKAVVALSEAVIGHLYKIAMRDHKNLAEQIIMKNRTI